jgi:hypothetical protein
MVVFSQSSPRHESHQGELNLRVLTDSARQAGCRVVPIPDDFDEVDPDDALWSLPAQPELPGVFIGYVSTREFYTSLFEAAARKGVRLINSPADSERAMEFDRFYPLIADLTPVSVIVREAADCARVGQELGYPVFVKGGIKSQKEKGWAACLAHSDEEIRARLAQAKGGGVATRDILIARRIAPLRPCPTCRVDFPAHREYRVYLAWGEVLGYGYYWGYEDPLGPLTTVEAHTVTRLAQAAAHRIACPLMAVDLGQTLDGSWIVIETGDLQYSGVSHMPQQVFWQCLIQLSQTQATRSVFGSGRS